MAIADAIAGASRPDLQAGIVDQAFDPELMANLAFPIQVAIASLEADDKGFVDFLGNPMDTAKVEREKAAPRPRKVQPEAIEQTTRAEGNNEVLLIMPIRIDVIPELLGAWVIIKRFVEIPSNASVLGYVLHRDEIS